MKRVLIAYATLTGATRGAAEAIAETLRGPEISVEVRRAQEVRDLGAYDAVLVGSGVYAGRLPGAVRKLVKRHAAALARLPVAFFLLCGTMVEPTPEDRVTADGYLNPLRQAAPEVQPLSVGLFAGAPRSDTPEFAGLFPLLKIMVRAMAQEQPERRDWNAIRDWAEELDGRLAAAWR